MSETWTWRYEDTDGAPMSGPELPETPFPTQGDAEAYLGEAWQELADAGVGQVTLLRDGEVVYAGMSLAPPE